MSDKRETITLATVTDTYNFVHGMPVELSFPDGRPLTFWRRQWQRIAWRLNRATRRWRPRSVVTHIMVDAGEIRLGIERWSWRRWRWERS